VVSVFFWPQLLFWLLVGPKKLKMKMKRKMKMKKRMKWMKVR
jgi:hypothetical protein